MLAARGVVKILHKQAFNINASKILSNTVHKQKSMGIAYIDAPPRLFTKAIACFKNST